ncbi:MAG TPA: RraA family protein [bacterium]|nr:RraA family protein [bacterium]
MTIGAERVVDQFIGFDPATLYEAADHQGMVDPAIRPAWPGARMCGIACTVVCPPGDNLMLHHAVAAAGPGMIIVATLGGYLRTGAWGEVLTVAAQARGVAGLAIDGAARDIEAIAERRFPVFARGLAIGSCTKERFGSLDIPIEFGGLIVRPGDIVLGDSDGIVIVAKERAEQILEAAARRRLREAEIMAELNKGKTTIELLHLPPLAKPGVSGT